MAIKVQGSTIIDDSRVLINTGNVGVGTTNPDTAVDSGNTGIVHAGIVTANKFYGDGSNLTGITAGQVGALAGFTVREEGSTVGTVGSVGDINFVSSNLTATASGVGATITLTETPEFDNLSVTGVSTFQDNVNLGDNDRLRLGTGDDLQIFHDGSNNYILGSNGDIILKNPSSDYFRAFSSTGAVQINYNGNKKFETTGAGVTVFGTTETQQLNVTGVSTFNSDVTITNTGNLILDASGPQSVIFKDGGSDGLQFSYFTNGDFLNLRRSSDGSNVFRANRDTSNIELYYNNSKKLETTNIGIAISNGTADTATITGPSNLVIDPAVVGDNTGSVRIKGDLFVDGTTTQINSTTLEIADFVVGIASTATTDLLTDGAGIQIGPDNTFLYEHNGGTNPSLKSSENLNVATGKVYQIAETERLSADTLSLGTGTTIHSPASNVLTLGTNGEERLRIASDGDIGIANNNPISPLDIALTSGAGDPRIRFYETSDNPIIELNRWTGNGTSYYAIRALSKLGDLALEFPNSVTTIGNHSYTEKVRITSAGNVGIGATTPDKKLVVRGADSEIVIDDTNGSPVLRLRNNGTTGGTVDLTSSNDLRFRAGGTTERLRITSGGLVGIGTDNPDTLLNLFGTGNTTIKVHNKEASVGTYSRLQLITGGVGSSSRSEIRSLRMSTSSAATNLAFFTTTAGDTSPTERLCINSAGYVGINETAPSNRLHVKETNSNTIVGRLESSGAYSYLSIEDSSTTTGHVRVGALGNDLLLRAGNANHVRITSGGDVTIGELSGITTQTSNVFYENNRRVLEVHGGDAQGWLALSATRNDTDAYVGGINFINRHGQIDNHRFLGYIRLKSTHVNTGQYGNAVLKGQLEFATKPSSTGISTTTPDMVIAESGNVGIGTDNPNALLHVQNDSVSDTKIIIESTGTNSYPGLRIKNDAHNYDLGIDGATDALRVYDVTGSAERLRITSDGKVGVGEDNVQAHFHVAKNIADSDAINWTGSQLSVATEISGNSTANRATIYFAPYGSDNNYAPSAISASAGTNGASTLKFFTNTSGNLTGQVQNYERLRITSDGEVGIGTDNPISDLHLFRTGDTTLILESDKPNTDENANPKLVFRQDGGVSASAIGMNFDSDSIGNDLFIANSISLGSIRFLTGTTNGYTNATERLRIGPAGQIGLGGTNYGTSGQVLTSNGANSAPTWQNASGGSGDKIEEGNTSAEVIDAGQDGRFVVTTEGTERLRITSDGFIGINETNPRTGLTINKWGTQPVSNTNTYPYPAGNWVTNWVTQTNNSNDYWAGFGGSGYLRSSATVNIALAPNHADINQQAGMYIAGEATSTTTSVFTIGKIVSGSATGISSLAGTQRATKDELFRITNTGNVGIGTDNPNNNSKLHIYDGSTGCDLTITSGNTNAIDINLGDVDDHDIGRIRYNNSNNSMSFRTNGSERLRIRSDGNVGIGTENPTELLHLAADSQHRILLKRSGAFPSEVTFGNEGNYAVISNNTSGIDLRTGSTPSSSMHIDQNGLVGIGTDNPAVKLEVAGTGSPILRISDLDGTDQFGQIIANNGNFVIESRNNTSTGRILFRGRDGSGAVEYGRFDSNGNLGIGTDNPTEKLDVRGNLVVGGSASSNYIAFQGTTGDLPSGSNGFRSFIGERIYINGTEKSELVILKYNDAEGSNDGPDRVRIVGANIRFDTYSSNNSHANFEAAATDSNNTLALLIDGSGNIGIGTDNPTEKLDVRGTTNIHNELKVVLDSTFSSAKNVARIIPLGFSGITGARNWALRGVYQYSSGVNINADGGDLDLIKSLNRNTILATKRDGSPLGNVGIGTDNPSEALHLNGGNAIMENSSGITLKLQRNDISTAANRLIGAIQFQGNDSNGTYETCAIIRAFSDLSHGTGDKPTRLEFYTTPDNSATPVERLRITSAGIVNIGDSSPNADGSGALNVYSGTSGALSQFVHSAGDGGLRIGGTGAGSAANLVFSNNYNSNSWTDEWTIRMDGGDDSLQFLSGGVSGTERLRIKSDGKVGIGTNDPSSPLHLQSTSTNQKVLTISANTGRSANIRSPIDSDPNTPFTFETANSWGFDVDSNRVLTLSSNYKVGIGTDDPREKFDVSAGRIILDQDYQFTWANGTTNRARIYGDSGNNFIVENGSSNTERLRITSDGKVRVPDNGTFVAGAGDDLQIYHNGNNYIDATEGNLYLRTTGGVSVNRDIYLRANNNLYLQSGGSSPGIKLNSGAATEIHHGGGLGKKLETTGAGVSVYGTTQTQQLNVTGVSTLSGNVIASSTLTVGDASAITGGAPADEGVLSVYGTGKNALIIQTTNNTSSRGIAFRNSADAYVGYISMENRGNNDADMVFGVDNTNETSVVNVKERLRITKEGNVGIGTDNPNYLLDVYKSTGTDQDVFAVRGQTSAFLVQCSDLSAANPSWNLRSFAAEDITIKPGNSESVRFKADGKVGIGTISPTHSLSSFGSGNSGGVRIENTHDTTTVSGNTASGAFPHNLLLSNYESQNGGSANRMASLGFDIPTPGGSHANATIAYQATNSSGNGDLQFWLEQNNTSIERLRITSTGTVGLSTASPASRLHVHAPGNDLSSIRLSGTAGSQVEYDIRQGIVGVNNAGFSIRDITNSATRFVISSAGKIGIGTGTPIGDFTVLTESNGYFSVGGTGGDGAQLLFHRKSNKAQSYSIQNNGGSNELVQHVLASSSGQYSWFIGGQSASNLKMRITSGGKVGINSTTPETGLDIRSDDGIFVRTATNGPTNGARIQFTDQTGSSNQRGFIRYKHPDNSISPGSNDGFLISGTEPLTVVRVDGRVIIDEKVGIGTVSPVSDLDVGIGTVTTKGSVDLRASDSTTQKFSMLYNETTDSLDFVYTA